MKYYTVHIKKATYPRMNLHTLCVFETSLRQRVEVAKPRKGKNSKSSGFQPLALTVAKNNVDFQVVVTKDTKYMLYPDLQLKPQSRNPMPSLLY